jgi:glutaredoxin/glutathione-dependent peroxiredoxin
MTINVGDKIPSGGFMELGDSGMQHVPTDEFFSGRKVLLFGLPGAFTPTCSAKHLPGYMANYDAFKAKGVDEIACVSVNDPFVMAAWGASLESDGRVRLLADGSCAMVRFMGLELDLTDKGMGIRSERFAMIVEDGVVTCLHIDPAGSFQTTSAEVMLEEA